MSAHKSKKPEEIIEEIRNSDTNKVKVAITDIDGILRGKYLNKEKFLSVADSHFGFCNVIFGWDSSDVLYDNSVFSGWHTGYPDILARLDLSTYRHVPWDNNVPFFLGEFEDSNSKPLEVCPRQLLKKVINRAKDMGFLSLSGMEFEWFNFKETPQSFADKGFRDPLPMTPGMFGYSILRSSQNQPFFLALMDEMEKFGVPIEGLHTETGPGVLEVAILFSESLEAADRAVLFKTGAKEIGYKMGIMPSFMAKWNATLPGCSGHIHQSLWDLNKEKNLFYDENHPLKMSKTFEHYIAGQMHCLPEILPFFAPTVNSYKRLVDGYWAPTKATWGVDNRTASFRLIPGSSKSTRVEVRVSGSDVNPYLAIAAATASGLYGIEHKLELNKPAVTGSAYNDTTTERLPRNLYEAANRLAESKVAREIFGESFVEHYANSRIWEWRQFQDAVTDWELKRYFEII
jgi:glutamine synthetase